MDQGHPLRQSHGQATGQPGVEEAGHQSCRLSIQLLTTGNQELLKERSSLSINGCTYLLPINFLTMFRLPRLPVGPLPARSLLVAFAKSVPRSANLSTRCLHSTLLPLSPAHVRLYSTPQQQAPPTPPSNAGVPAPSTSRTDFQKLSYKSILFLGLSGLSLLLYFNHEKNKIEKSRETLKDVSAGKPKVGGPFALTDHNGNPATDKDFRGKWMLVYFGYTFCPDVCPDELDKMAAVVEKLSASSWTRFPIFLR